MTSTAYITGVPGVVYEGSRMAIIVKMVCALHHRVTRNVLSPRPGPTGLGQWKGRERILSNR